MLTSERKRLLLERLRRDGRIVAKDIAGDLGLSEDTIRRDLRDMAAEGLLARVHGGALPRQPDLPDFATRRTLCEDEKRSLADRAVALLRPGMLVFVDGGTTNEAVIRRLPPDLRLTIATHSPTIASALEDHSGIDVWLIGGRLYRHSMVTVGAEAAGAISLLAPDLFLMGVTGIHPHRGFTTGDAEEAAIKRLIARQSRETWILATTEKLDQASPFTILPLHGATGVVLSGGTTDEQTQALPAAGLRLL
ncbi:MAG: DeoR/GlpR transcriptional regulator [Telmatospirillum sp.]|nr:DeoR/GlpR transcriptional regulator [Telmatospirillum sp.]